ncbi:MAG: ammonia-forming cytochrome c nitrite reductase subunit c552, partial [Clostridia bacterium]|nr:ammonia-forming cytochrome c nitrite reductase subunit c552 [Clostridia bacterium]
MEKKTIAMLVVSALILILGVVFACGIGRGGEVIYQKPGPYTAERSNDYSNVQVAMTIQGDQILDAEITSSGDNDLLTDELRAQWADSIVANQSYENDVISSASLKYSADSVKEAAADIFTQAGLPTPEPEPEPEPEAEAPADEAATPADGEFHVEKTTDFSTIDVGITVEDGKITDASVTSAPLEGQVDMLTDDIRSAWAQQIVEKQAVDAVSGVTVSSDAVKESVEQLMVQVNGGGEAAGLADGTYQIQETTDFSTIDVEMTVEDGKITDASVTSAALEGQVDMLTDDHRAAWAEQIVQKQAVDAVSGVTVSSTAVQEAVDELMAQAASGSEAAADDGRIAALEVALAEAQARAEAAEAKAAELETANAAAEAKVAELEAAAAALAVAGEAQAEPEAEASGLTDGTYAVRKTTDFSDIDVAVTVLDGKLTQAAVSSEALEGQVDMLTDDIRNAWAEQIVNSQSVDAVSGVTVSSTAVQEAVDELMARAKGDQAEAEAPATEAGSSDISRFVRPRPVSGTVSAEAAPEVESMGLADGTYAVRKTTDFSDIDVAVTVLDGNLTQAVVSSEALEGQVDMLTDDIRNAWADQIVNSQAVDAVSGVTVSSTAVQEAVDELMARAAGEAAEAEEVAEAPTTEAESSDISRFVRPRPGSAVVNTETDAGEAAPSESDSTDISRFVRPRPGSAAPSAEAEAAEAAVSEAESSDISRFVRPRPGSAAPSAEAEAGETASAEAESTDISRFVRPRPGTQAAADENEEADAAELTEEERLKAILPGIVTTMGDNRENSYVVDYLEQDPYLVNIYEGYGFAKDYGSARGHEYTLEDVAKTQRPHPKANCITCKTPDLHKMIEEQGVAVYSMPFDEVFPQMTNNVSCYTCHGDDMGAGGALKVTHQYVNEALGENVARIDPATL